MWGVIERSFCRPNSEATEAVMANTMEVGQPAPRPTKKRASNPAEANQRHIKTEQARRDKIAAGFNVSNARGTFPSNKLLTSCEYNASAL